VNKILSAQETLIGRGKDGQKNAHKDGKIHKVFCFLILPMNVFFVAIKKLLFSISTR